MNPDSLEDSIQKLLSVLYPPFEATAPTLLSQLFHTIERRYQGDALRCLLDFLVPAKHILDTVQQAACAQYSNALFRCEGWPLCLRDRVVIHLAPINPPILRPGDFYLQVAPFCDQSARILVCSLLEEEGLGVEVVEETPIPETSYPCIFSTEWLKEINHGRHGTPLSRCLLATEQGVVRLPWERVALPDFVDRPQCSGSSMASVPPSCPPLPPPLPPPLHHFSDNRSFHPSKEPEPDSASSPHPSALSVQTRIRHSKKHGIAVSLCLVDASAAPSSRLTEAKATETEPRPIGWVSPNTWDSRFTGSSSGARSPSSSSPHRAVPQNTGQCRDTSGVGTVDQAAAEGEYIDVVQATMLFSKAQALKEERQRSDMRLYPHARVEAQMQRFPPRRAPAHAQVEPCRQTLWQPNAHVAQAHADARSDSAAPPAPDASAETGPPSARHHSPSRHTHAGPPDPSQCVRTVRFSEKPCTPCMQRRRGGPGSRAPEARCRYRDSYQAALQNPVTFGQERRRADMLAVVREDEDFSQCDDRRGPPDDPWCDVRGTWCDPGDRPPLCVSGGICKESGETNAVAHWTAGDSNTVERRRTNPGACGELPEQPVWENGYAQSAAPVNGRHFGPLSAQHQGSRRSSGDTSGTNVTLRPQERVPNRASPSGMSADFSKALAVTPNRPESSGSDGRCSSLSTAVVDTSEKCELVIVEGQNVRRRENGGSGAEVPQLHVVKCKNSTAFRLVSPKVNRRKVVAPDDVPHQTHDPSHTDPPSAAETPSTSHHASAQPRPDHLPLGSPDPRAHPLYLGVASLTGGRDRTGRAVVELYGDHPGWKSAATSQEVFHMLLYFHLITRREIREAGMTLVFDARKTNPQPQLYKALMTLQEQNLPVLNSLLLLVDKDNSFRPERCPGLQTDTVTSMKAVLKLVEASQLSSRLDGSLPHSHCDWMELHQKLFPFVSDLHEASCLLLNAISKLEEPQRTDTVQAVQQCMMDQRTLMRDVLEDSRLVGLQREGGAMLARLRRESDLKYPHCEGLSDAVDSVTSLYNHMEEQAHVLVQRSNVSVEHLEYLLQLREMEGHFTQIQQWFHVEGERHLLEAESVEDSGERMEQILNSFTGFLIEANDRRHHAMSLVSAAEQLQQSGLSYPETGTFGRFIGTFKSGLDDFLCRAESCGRELQIMVNVCDFCEQATALATECTDYLNQTQTNTHPNQDSGPNSTSPCQSECPAPHPSGPTPTGAMLQTFQDRFLQFSPERFQEVKAQADALNGTRGMRVWNIAWLRCQEARQQLQERMQDADEPPQRNPESSSCRERHYVDVVSADIQVTSPGGQNLVVQSTPGPRHPQWQGVVSGAVDVGKGKANMGDGSSNTTNVACCNIVIKPEEHSDAGASQGSKVTPPSPHRSGKRTEREARRRQSSRARRERDAAALSQSHTVGCQWFPWARGLRARSVSQDSGATGAATAGSTTPPEQRVRSPSSCSHHGQPSCRILKEAQKFQISRHGSFCSEDSCPSERGAAGGDDTVCCKHSSLPIGGRYEGAFFSVNPQERTSSSSRLQRVLEELVVTEREYVRSLNYILTHYFPLLERADIPQDLRGKRGVIFGNLEKLYNFHSHYFLPELEACQREPAMAARCFLRHGESFGLYALYSKNKPQSDALILHRRHDIFKRKQQELGDLMDLSSYLLRPIQRISKYSLLLQDMLSLAASHRPKDLIQDSLLESSVCAQSVCGPGVFVPDPTSGERERERAEIQAAANLVRFQMRHGNDLLTMDAIRDCDVNLKEQGQLIRQDEFTVFFRKKKCVRRIFLFEHLILFSKTKKTDVGNDVYVYKQSFKTSDIGMTHNSGMGGLCFEIWFRRRKSEDTYTLKSCSVEVKKAWTTDLERILWDQATHSRELRLQERVFMGIPSKHFMDIQPSDAAICDRAVSRALPGRIPVACCSHRGLDFPRPHSIGSGSTASTTLSQSSSSSGRGSLPPAGYPGNQSQGSETAPAICSSPEAVTDNEFNNHHLHQHHHLHRNCEPWKGHHHSLMDSTTSSGECINLLSGSDPSCLSAIGGEAADDSSSSSCQSQNSKPRPPPSRTPSLRRNSSPVVIRKKPDISPKPPHLTSSQSDVLIPKSTEV